MDNIGVVNDLVRFVRIARDLSRGLTCLHAFKLVHRDIKLENCGLDHQERAKLFDLGLVTSDPKDVRGNIFTRAPELFSDEGLLKQLRPRSSSDVWALGATLYALRFEEYPFVHRSEIEQRRQINDDLKAEKIDSNVADQKKRDLMLGVQARIQKKGAFDVIAKRIRQKIGGVAADILLSMLSFNERDRRAAEAYADEWGRLARDLSGVASSSGQSPDKWVEIVESLQSVLKSDLTITRKQLERLASELKEEKRKVPPNSSLKAAEALITKIKGRERHVGAI